MGTPCWPAKRHRSRSKTSGLSAFACECSIDGANSLFINLASDSKLHGWDLVRLRVRDVAHGGRIAARATVMQQKTPRPVQ